MVNKNMQTKTTLPRVMIFLLVVTFTVRLFQLQVIRHQYYLNVVNNEHSRDIKIHASRGGIYFSDARNKQIYAAALSEPIYTLAADPSFIDDVEVAVNSIAQSVSGIDVSEVRKKLNSDSQYVVIKTSLNGEQAQKIRSDNVKGLLLSRNYQRTYIEDDIGRRILGFVNNDGEGQYGVEGYLDEEIGGQDGSYYSPVYPDQSPINVDTSSVTAQVRDGKSVVLTIDRSLQETIDQLALDANKKFAADSTSVVIMNTSNSDVVAMSTKPGLESVNIDNVEDFTIFQTPSTYQAYEPGSIMKTITMASGIENGVISPSSTYHNTGQVVVDTETISNVDRSVDGLQLSMQDVLSRSLNTGTVFVLGELGGGEINPTGKAKLFKTFQDFGFSRPTGIEQFGESGGLVRAPGESQFGDDLRYANMSFGQGLTVTLTQMATAYSAIINDGVYIQPTLIKGFSDGASTPSYDDLVKPDTKSKRVVSQNTAQEVRNMLKLAAQANRVVAPLNSDTLEVGGKTGTAQIPNPQGGYYEDRFIGGYIGYISSGDQSYIIAVRIDNPKVNFAGSGAAAPVFVDAARAVSSHYNMNGN